MGYTLEMYALDISRLEESISADTLATSIRSGGEAAESVQRGIGELLSGELTDRAANILAELIRRLGRPLAALEHASRSGLAFRKAASDVFGHEDLAPLNRAIAGRLRREDFPWFGWLRNDEISAIEFDSVVDRVSDPDVQGWEADIARALRFALTRGTDIVTIYT